MQLMSEESVGRAGHIGPLTSHAAACINQNLPYKKELKPSWKNGSSLPKVRQVQQLPGQLHSWGAACCRPWVALIGHLIKGPIQSLCVRWMHAPGCSHGEAGRTLSVRA